MRESVRFKTFHLTNLTSVCQVLHHISSESIKDPLFDKQFPQFPGFIFFLPLFNLFTKGGWHLMHLLHPQRHLLEERDLHNE